MTTVTVEYGTTTAFTFTSLNTLAQDAWASCAIVDNTSTLAVDYLIGGQFKTDAAGWADGDSIEVYAYADYGTAVSGDTTGGIGTGLGGTDTTETEGTAFQKENLRLLDVVVTSGAADTEYHFGPVSLAAAFGGVCPERFGLLVHNNAAGAGGALNATDGGDVYYTAIKYVSA